MSLMGGVRIEELSTKIAVVITAAEASLNLIDGVELDHSDKDALCCQLWDLWLEVKERTE